MFVFIVHFLFYKNNNAFHYVEYYGHQNYFSSYINILEQTKIKIKEYYQKKLLGKRINQSELEKLFELIEEIYFYIKEIIFNKKSLNEASKIVIYILNIIITKINNKYNIN